MGGPGCQALPGHSFLRRTWESHPDPGPRKQRRCLVFSALVVVLVFPDLELQALAKARARARTTQAAALAVAFVSPPELPRRTLLSTSTLLLSSAPLVPLPAEAIFGIGDAGPKLSTYTVAEAFNISFPPEWEVLTETPEGLVVQGDRIQPLERMTAGAKRVSYSTLAEGWGTNITEVGERLAAKRPTGAAELLDAKADPNGDGLDMYQFEFTGDKLSELWIIALVKRGSDNFLCNVACRTPKLLYDSKRDEFSTVMKSFTPLSAAPASSEPEPVTVS